MLAFSMFMTSGERSSCTAKFEWTIFEYSILFTEYNNYTNWMTSQQSCSTAGNENCVAVFGTNYGNSWKNIPCNSTAYPICEFHPPGSPRINWIHSPGSPYFNWIHPPGSTYHKWIRHTLLGTRDVE